MSDSVNQIQINKSKEEEPEERKHEETITEKIAKLDNKIEDNFKIFYEIIDKYHDLRILCDAKDKRIGKLENQLIERDLEI